MSNKMTMNAQLREKAGKGAARAVRRTGRIPGVIYGDNKEPVLVSLEEKDVVKALYSGSIFTALCDLDVEGDKKHVTLVRDIQLDPVSDRPVHIDYLRVTKKTMIKVNVPVSFINEEKSPGLARGGVLSTVRHDVEVLARATEIPESFVIDLEGTEVGDNIPFSKLQVPEGVTPTIEDRDFIIASITAPSALRSASGAAEAADEAEGEEAAAEEAAEE